MTRLLRITAAPIAIALCCAASASAQPQIGIIDSVFFHTGAAYSIERPMFRTFGFHRDYSDSIDQDLPIGWEREIPAFPPQSFFVLFDALIVPAWIDKDIRGIPDSVLSGRSRQFSLRYEFEIQRYDNPQVTIVFPHELPIGIDSINFRDNIGTSGGLIFNKTLTSGPDSVLIPGGALTRVRMTVYYNVQVTGIRPLAEVSAVPLATWPNPARAGSAIHVRGSFPDGTRFLLSDPLGRSLLLASTRDEGSTVSIDLSGISSGAYIMRAVAPSGRVVGQDRVVVTR